MASPDSPAQATRIPTLVEHTDQVIGPGLKPSLMDSSDRRVQPNPVRAARTYELGRTGPASELIPWDPVPVLKLETYVNCA